MQSESDQSVHYNDRIYLKYRPPKYTPKFNPQMKNQEKSRKNPGKIPPPIENHQIA